MATYRYLVAVIILSSLYICAVHSVDRNNFKTCDQSGFCKRQRQYVAPTDKPYSVDLSSLKVENDYVQFFIKNLANDAEFVMKLVGYEGGIVRIYMNEKEPIKPRYHVPSGHVVLEEQLKILTFTVESQDSSSFTLALADTDTKVKVSNPFLIDVSSAETALLRINSRGLFKFEHIRVKPGLLSSAKQATASFGTKVINWITSPFRAAAVVEDTPAADSEDDEDKEDADQPADGDEAANQEGTQNSEEEKEKAEKDDGEKPEEAEEHAVWEEKFKTHQDNKPNGATSIGLDLSFIGYENVYGIPEHGDSFALKSTVGKDPYRLYNLDVFEYELDTGMALYGSVPVMLAHNTHQTIGVFWNNPSEMWIDISSSTADRSTLKKIAAFVTQDDTLPQMDTRWVAESGVLDLYVMLGPKPNDVYKQYAMLTGTTQLPPLFSIAYHQSRWNYNDDADVKQIHDNFDLHDIPLDVVWLDIEHTDGKRYFTWDASKFPDSLAMVANLTAKGRKLVTIVDPHIKRDDNYKIYKEIKDRDLFIKDRDGKEFDGWCWPGSSSYPDFSRADMREYWASKFAFDEYTGTNENVFTWNDMNEPSVFNGPEITMHKDAQHDGGWEHRDLHNLYGFYVHQATVQGQIKRSQGALRPFVLSRAFYAGSQRHGAVWTGDNMGEWSHLKISLPMILSQAVTGITFTGADIGGFFRNPSHELITRWYQTAAFTPFFRAHSHLDTKRREPWLLPGDHMKIIRDAIITRYQLLPYWYTLFYENEKEGVPPTRPMWSEFPQDASLMKIDDQFMLGSAVLVKPVMDEGATSINVVFPGGKSARWYSAKDNVQYQGGVSEYMAVTLEDQPYFYRGGYIVPRKDRVRRSSTQMTDDPYTLIVALDSKAEASGDLYIDDYKSFQYREGQYIYRTFQCKDNKLTSSAKEVTDFKTASWLESVKVLGLIQKPSSVKLTVDGQTRDLQFSYDAKKSVLTIRKPGCNIADDWSISF